jgi:hypothetical protein
MQDTTHSLIPVDSDVNEFMQDTIVGFDSYVSSAFKELNIKGLLSKSGIVKRSGLSADKMFFNMIQIPFLMLSTLFLFIQEQIEGTLASKSSYYRFLENSHYNWSKFTFLLSVKASKYLYGEYNPSKYFIVDDTIREVNGKMVEGASYIYDHVKGKTVLGFNKLVLGVFNGTNFLPVAQKICGGKRKPQVKSKATKYNKIPKSERIELNSPGYAERESLINTKLDLTYTLLKKSKKKFESVEFVLFDSWFCFNSFITRIKKSLNLDIICQLKNLPRANKYTHKDGKNYSLAQLYIYFVKARMKKAKKKDYKTYTLKVLTSKTNVELKIVFIKNETENKFHAFATTKIELTSEQILEYYSQRWAIEVFFKNCKQYLNYGKEQVSNIDSIVASDNLVFTRYTMLTYIAFRNKISFYDSLQKCRKQKKFIEYGLRLLNYFLKKLTVVIDYVIQLLESGEKEYAKHTLREIIKSSNEFGDIVSMQI